MGRHKASIGFIKPKIQHSECTKMYQSDHSLLTEVKPLEQYVYVLQNLSPNKQKAQVFKSLKTVLKRYDGVRKYLPEVGFNMHYDPPKPLMDAEFKHLPASFPQEISTSSLEHLSQGRFRIVDIVMLNIADHEIFKMQQTGIANWIRFYPDQRYIKTLIALNTKQQEWGVAREESWREVFDMAYFPLNLKYEKQEMNMEADDTDIPKIQNTAPYQDKKMTLLPDHLNKQRFLGRLISKCKDPIKMITKETPLDDFQKKLTPVVLNSDYPIGMIFGQVRIAEKKKKQTLVMSHFATSKSS